MRADPSADGREGACFLDQLQGILISPLGRKAHIGLDIDVRRASHLARRRLLFLGSGLTRHRIAAGALLIVVKDDACHRIGGDGQFRTGLGTGRIVTMVTEQRPEERRPFKHPDHSRADAKPVLLFAGHFTSMAAHAFNLVKHQGYFSHLFLPLIYPTDSNFFRF